jgi:hypothetical protein
MGRSVVDRIRGVRRYPRSAFWDAVFAGISYENALKAQFFVEDLTWFQFSSSVDLVGDQIKELNDEQPRDIFNNYRVGFWRAV